MYSKTNNNIDESLYSRQLFTFGKDGMMTLQKAVVLISNLNGLGLEIAKCVILGGVKKVILHDENKVTFNDLTTNYYQNKTDIGKNRAEVCLLKLKELNPYVDVIAITTSLTLVELVKQNITTVVLVDYPLNKQMEFNDFTHKNSIKMITCSTYGLFGQIYCDFGENFTVKDKDGEEVRTGVVPEIRYHDKGTIIVTGQNHKMSYDDKINILSDSNSTELKELLGVQQVTRVLSSTQLLIEKKILKDKDSVKVLKNVHYEQVKQPLTLNFKSLRESLTSPSFTYMDFDPSKAELYHTIFQALHKFSEKFGELPKVKDLESTNILTNFCKEINKDFDMKDDSIKKTVNLISMTSQGKLCPMEAVIGSIVAQEVMKASMNKYTPINQWLYFESLSSLPKNYLEEDSKNFETDNLSEEFKRYTGQIKVFGKKFQEELNNKKIFVVGSGAIGCEHLKNFAMMGVGNLVVTDMDTIEKSNLNRQFLFRSTHIGKPKSTTASQEAMKLNNQVSITAQQYRVGQETLNIYNEQFFKSLDCVTNALDNVQARLFVDSLCVSHHVPLLESGTLGTSGNVQTIIPKLTESYGSQQDPPEQSIPVCTLKNFPYMPEHCIQWSRELFEGTFVQSIKNLNQYLKDPKSLHSMPLSEVHTIVTDINKVAKYLPSSYQDCVDFGFKLWHDLYRDQIANLLHKYPANYESDGVPFWSGTKKCPVLFAFDTKDPLHTGFVYSTANLWADIFGIKHESQEFAINLINKLVVPKLVISGENISVTEEEEKNKTKNNNNSVEELLQSIPSVKYFDKFSPLPIEFEKDDDTNFHIDFIANASNLRSRNYSIKELDRLKIKGVAGKIIPAIATTTSLVSGLVSLELYKVLNKMNKIEDYRNYYMNMGTVNFQYTEPACAQKQKIGKIEYTLWDSFEFKDTTLQEIIDYFDDKYNLEISGFTIGQLTLLSSFMQLNKQAKRKTQKFSEIYKELTNKDPEDTLQVTLIVETDDDNEDEDQDVNNDIEMPVIKIKI